MIKWPKTLVRGLAYDNLTILFGAGVPHELNFPLWDELIDKIYNDNNNTLGEVENNEVNQYIKSKDYMNAIELLDFKNHEGVYDYLSNEFYIDDFKHEEIMNSNEKLLFDLNAGVYLTTNIDNSLEEVKGVSGKRASHIYSYEDEEDIRDKVISYNSETDPLIVRLHGDLKKKSSLIFTQSQYTKINKKDYFVFKQLLPALFLITTVLIIGYSVSDPDIKLILEKGSKIRGSKNNIFFLNADKNLSEHKKRMFWSRFGIQVVDIYYESNDINSNLKKSLLEMIAIKEELSSYSLSEKRSLFKLSGNNIIDELQKKNMK